MSGISSIFPTVRLAVFSAVTVLSVIVLAMSAHVMNFTLTFYKDYYYGYGYTSGGFYYSFAALSLATSLLTVLTLPVMLVVDHVRKNAPSSMISFELGWTGVLWVMWLASAGQTASTNATGGKCDTSITKVKTACQEINVIEAFDFLNWLALLVYFFALLFFTIVAHNRGHSVWTSSVKETNFDAPAVAPQHVHNDKGIDTPMTTTPMPQYHSQAPNAGFAPAAQPASPYPQV